MTRQEIVQALRCCAKGIGHDDACENCKVGEIQDRREYIEFAAANTIERLTAELAVCGGRDMKRLTRPNINVDPDTDRFLHAAIGGKEIDWKQNRDSTLNVFINGPTSNGFCKDIFRKMARDLYGRLKAYEDTGLEPEAVETVKLALAAKHMVDLETLNNTTISRLVELAEADKDGRVVVLPCKVGDTVYFALLGRIIEKQVFSIVSFSNSTRIYCGGTSEYFRPEDIGKTFFLTREEAEKALREMEGKKDGKT